MTDIKDKRHSGLKKDTNDKSHDERGQRASTVICEKGERKGQAGGGRVKENDTIERRKRVAQASSTRE